MLINETATAGTFPSRSTGSRSQRKSRPGVHLLVLHQARRSVGILLDGLPQGACQGPVACEQVHVRHEDGALLRLQPAAVSCRLSPA